jgi:fructokinase
MIGKYPAKMDDKNRLFVPAKLREELGEEFYVTLGTTGGHRCLTVYPAAAWQRLTENYNALSQSQRAKGPNVLFNNAIECNPEVLTLASEADVICWGSLAQRSEKSRESILAILDAAPETCLMVFDINIRQKFYTAEVIEESLKRADILKLNEDELPIVCELFGIEGTQAEQISQIIERYDLKNVIFTQGAVCSEVYDADGLVSRMDTPKVEVADTVGAGDSFTATYVTSILLGRTPLQAHELAVKVAAFVCTQNGAINPLPSEYL